MTLALEAPSLSVSRYRFRLVAVDQVVLPPFVGSTLRGAFGNVFRRMVCATHQPDCHGCPLWEQCPYPYVFLTTPAEGQPLQHQKDVPRPFVFQVPPPRSEEWRLAPGEALEFWLNLFGQGGRHLPYFIVAFDELSRVGMGRGRGRMKLERVASEEGDTIFESATRTVYERSQSLEWAQVLDRLRDETATQATVRLVTPTRLKANARWIGPDDSLSFAVLMRTLLRRVTSLWAFHGQGRPEWDFAGILQAAREVRLVRQQLRALPFRRYSSRQKTSMDLGGVVGEAVYEGDLSPFLPLLVLGMATHVGKNATFGLGQLEVEWI